MNPRRTFQNHFMIGWSGWYPPLHLGISVLRGRGKVNVRSLQDQRNKSHRVNCRRLSMSIARCSPPMTICSSLASWNHAGNVKMSALNCMSKRTKQLTNMRIQSTGMRSWNPRKKARLCCAVSLECDTWKCQEREEGGGTKSGRRKRSVLSTQPSTTLHLFNL